MKSFREFLTEEKKEEHLLSYKSSFAEVRPKVKHKDSLLSFKSSFAEVRPKKKNLKETEEHEKPLEHMNKDNEERKF